jgi:hypothetical protein
MFSGPFASSKVHKFEFQKWPTAYVFLIPPAAVSQEWRLELTQLAHSTVSSGDQPDIISRWEIINSFIYV